MKYVVKGSLIFETRTEADLVRDKLNELIEGRSRWKERTELPEITIIEVKGLYELIFDLRFNTKTDMEETFTALKDFAEPKIYRGYIAEHECAHDEAMPYKSCAFGRRFRKV